MSASAQAASVLELRPQPGPQEQFASTRADIAVFGGQAGGGKRVANDTIVPVPLSVDPSGYKKHGDVRAGDYVYSPTGNPVLVIQAWPITENTDAYEMKFDTGEAIVADGDHLWHTYTESERDRILRSSPDWRERRKRKRQSRSKTNSKKPGVSVSITAINRARVYDITAPTGGVRTTREIAMSLRSRRGALNHTIDVARAIVGDDKPLPIDPYLLGLWIGDGYSHTGVIGMTIEDWQAIDKYVPIPVRETVDSTDARRKPFSNRRFDGLTKALKSLGLLRNKHIPAIYMRASQTHRLALMQGMLDTDGTCGRNGQIELGFSDRRLAEDALELACSLGSKATLRRKRTTHKDHWRFKFVADFTAFRLPRKAMRQRKPSAPSVYRRTIVSVRKVPSVLMRCITVANPDGLYLIGRTFITTHNSFALLLDPTRFVNIKGFGAVIFRRNATDLTQEGGLWDESRNIYPAIGGAPRESAGRLDYRFNGNIARISFAHLSEEETVQQKMGGQIAMMGFDELTHFSSTQFWLMVSRNRSTCGIKPYIRASCNPDPDSWVAKLLAWWICEETGFPISQHWWDRVHKKYKGIERSGVLRYLIKLEEMFHWFDSEDEANAWRDERGLSDKIKPISVTFIPSRLEDNPKLTVKDPTYGAKLSMLGRVDRARLLDGNWKIRRQAGLVFQKNDFKIIELQEWERMQKDIIKTVRSWDLAGTEAKRSRNPKTMVERLVNNPDYTVGLRAHMLVNKDIVFSHMCRDRLSPGGVRKLVKDTAEGDGRTTPIRIPQDPGQAGKDQIHDYQKNLLMGWRVVSRTETGSMLTRAEDFGAYVEHGHVMVVRGAWNDQFLDEHEVYPSPGVHDDIVSASTGAYSHLTEKEPSTAELMARRRGG